MKKNYVQPPIPGDKSMKNSHATLPQRNDSQKLMLRNLNSEPENQEKVKIQSNPQNQKSILKNHAFSDPFREVIKMNIPLNLDQTKSQGLNSTNRDSMQTSLYYQNYHSFEGGPQFSHNSQNFSQTIQSSERVTILNSKTTGRNSEQGTNDNSEARNFIKQTENFREREVEEIGYHESEDSEEENENGEDGMP